MARQHHFAPLALVTAGTATPVDLRRSFGGDGYVGSLRAVVCHPS